MKLSEISVQSLYLKPGELCVAEVPACVTTVLGSCVSVTLFSSRFRIGAMCHALLPEGPAIDAFRYVDGSIIYMLNKFKLLGIDQTRIEVKLFGGADQLTKAEKKSFSVGSRNVEIAREVLKEEGLVIKAEDVGGEKGRKLIFYTHTGEVWLKRLNRGEGFCQ